MNHCNLTRFSFQVDDKNGIFCCLTKNLSVCDLTRKNYFRCLRRKIELLRFDEKITQFEFLQKNQFSYKNRYFCLSVSTKPKRSKPISSLFFLSLELSEKGLNIFIFCRGTFRMERDDGYSFDCRIPPFSLESKGDDPNDPAIVGNWKIVLLRRKKNTYNDRFSITTQKLASRVVIAFLVKKTKKKGHKRPEPHCLWLLRAQGQKASFSWLLHHENWKFRFCNWYPKLRGFFCLFYFTDFGERYVRLLWGLLMHKGF